MKWTLHRHFHWFVLAHICHVRSCGLERSRRNASSQVSTIGRTPRHHTPTRDHRTRPRTPYIRKHLLGFWVGNDRTGPVMTGKMDNHFIDWYLSCYLSFLHVTTFYNSICLSSAVTSRSYTSFNEFRSWMYLSRDMGSVITATAYLRFQFILKCR